MKTIIFVLMLFLASTVTGQTIDLHKLTLNGLALKELTVDKLTTILGRPSAVQSNSLASDLIGPEVYYHQKGLHFWFKTKNKDSEQRIWIMTVYLSKEWDDSNKEFFMPFTGVVIPKINNNMKINEVLPLFKKFEVEVKSGQERRKKFSNDSGMNPNFIKKDAYTFNISGYGVSLQCDEVTKFVERIDFTFFEPQP